MRFLFIILSLAFNLSLLGQAFTFRDPAYMRRLTATAAPTYTLYTNYVPTSDRGNFSGLVGMIWTNSAAITVTDLGTWVSGNNNRKQQLQLVNFTNLTAVASVWINTSNSTTGAFAYTNITPVTLIVGAEYCLVRDETASPDAGATVFQDGSDGPAAAVFSSGTYGGSVFSTTTNLAGITYGGRLQPYGPHDLKYTLP